MLKQNRQHPRTKRRHQPPLGGCVLKQKRDVESTKDNEPAAFRRLCVETILEFDGLLTQIAQPPLGGCVLKPYDALYLHPLL